MNDSDLDRLADRLFEKMTARMPPPEPAWPRLMDVATAAKYLGRTDDAVRMMMKRGVLPVTKVDGRLQFDREQLDKLIERSTRWPLPAA